MIQAQPQTSGFSNLGIDARLLSTLNYLKFTTPTPIQEQCIPHAITGKDIVGIAQTGTGKTLAFGIPIVQRLAKSDGQALILLPTRELALQVEEVLRKIGGSYGLMTAVIIGGASSYQQKNLLRRNPHVIISTPGRLLDHINQKNVALHRMKIVVLDEADRMFDIGFMNDIKKILNATPKERQTLMFSATMPKEIADIAAHYMKVPLRIEVAPAGTSASNVEQEVFIVARDAKPQLLEKLLIDNKGTVLIFTRTKHAAKRIAANINSMGHAAAELHSNRSLGQRKEAMAGFKSGKYRVMVATDIAARGIDVKDISLVINFDLPDNHEDYVHRIGRTGRAEKYGKAVTFATPEERMDIKHIERLIRKTIPIIALPVLPPRRFHAPVPRDVSPYRHVTAQRSGGQGGGGGQQYRGNYPPRRQGGQGGGNWQKRPKNMNPKY
ncbi:MAG: DEAD/DEAH box helicase [bacterium]|nr:DEAD/DEAH box helicase [bacterium]